MPVAWDDLQSDIVSVVFSAEEPFDSINQCHC